MQQHCINMQIYDCLFRILYKYTGGQKEEKKRKRGRRKRKGKGRRKEERRKERREKKRGRNSFFLFIPRLPRYFNSL